MPAKTKDTRIKIEKERLTKLFADLSPDQWALAQGLVDRAAWQRIELEDLEKYLKENGWAMKMQQSKDLPAFDRARPQASEYQKLIANYLKTIKDLKGWLQITDTHEIDDGFDTFSNGRDCE